MRLSHVETTLLVQERDQGTLYYTVSSKSPSATVAVVGRGDLRPLGDLETAVMRVVWASPEPVSVREVHAALATRKLAYTTVMTVLDRLWRKRFLRRNARGRAYLYSPTVSEAEYTAGLMHGVLAQASDRAGALAHFVRGMRKADEAELRHLAGEASRRRRPR
jgi:predicted transcriptional regulator